jgi:hypothetical protein
MMEVSAIMKISKNSFYRSMLVFQKVCCEDAKILFGKKLREYVCGAVGIGAKFESGSSNYLSNVHSCNFRRISKAEIEQA